MLVNGDCTILSLSLPRKVGIHPTSLIAQVENGERLTKPNNVACSDAMYVNVPSAQNMTFVHSKKVGTRKA